MKNFWTQENLAKVSSAFLSKGEQNWCKICSKLNILPGNPDFYIKNAYYGKQAVADYYDFEYASWYDEKENLVIVENPYPVAVSMVFSENCFEPPPSTKYVKLDAELARKILVLGVPDFI